MYLSLPLSLLVMSCLLITLAKCLKSSKVSMIGHWRSSLNVFVFVIVFIFVFVGHVMSPHQSDQIFQRSRVSRIGPWSCSLNVFSLSFLWSGHVSFIILVLNSPWPLLELLHSVIQNRAIGQSVLTPFLWSGARERNNLQTNSFDPMHNGLIAQFDDSVSYTES